MMSNNSNPQLVQVSTLAEAAGWETVGRHPHTKAVVETIVRDGLENALRPVVSQNPYGPHLPLVQVWYVTTRVAQLWFATIRRDYERRMQQDGTFRIDPITRDGHRVRGCNVHLRDHRTR